MHNYKDSEEEWFMTEQEWKTYEERNKRRERTVRIVIYVVSFTIISLAILTYCLK